MTSWSDIASTVGKYAPVVGQLLGGSAGATVGNMIASTLGVEVKPEQIKKALQTEQAQIQLKALELENQQAFNQLLIEELKLRLHDTQHARKTHKHHWMPSLLTIILALMVMIIFICLIIVPHPEHVSSSIYLITGQVIGGFITAIAFWLGTSKSSQEKNRWMENQKNV